jgi:hypothetical protein
MANLSNINNKLIVEDSGDVGIGVTSATTKLHIGGTAPGDSIIRQDSTVSGTNWEIGERAAGKWQIFEDDGDSIVATFMSTGNVGIGATDPVKKLDVRGQLAISNSASSYWYLDRNDSTGNFEILTDTNSSVFNIDSSGNVTIGNSTYGSSLGQLRIINDAASSPASLSLFGCSFWRKLCFNRFSYAVIWNRW